MGLPRFGRYRFSNSVLYLLHICVIFRVYWALPPTRDKASRVRSNFWKFCLIKTGFTLDEPVSLLKVFRLFKLEQMFFWVLRVCVDTVGRCTNSYLLAGPVCLWALVYKRKRKEKSRLGLYLGEGSFRIFDLLPWPTGLGGGGGLGFFGGFGFFSGPQYVPNNTTILSHMFCSKISPFSPI
jgi:hypothetical protein